MKKIIFTVAAILAFGFANAQETNESSHGFSKGNIVMTGSVGFGSSKYTESGNYKENNFEFSPAVGYFVTDNIALGVGLNFGTSSVEATSTSGKSEMNTIGFQGFGRYYMTPADKFSLFGHLGVEYASVDFKDAGFKVNGFGIMAAPGVSYFLTKNIAMEAKWGVLSYATAKADTPGAETSTNFDLNVDLANINFGFLYKF